MSYIKFLLTGKKTKLPYKEFLMQVRGYQLELPDGVYNLADLYENCNGCGKANSWFQPPDTIFGIDIQSACHVHDIAWTVATSRAQLELANRHFTVNLKRICDAESSTKFTSWVRRLRIATYSWAVDRVGLEIAIKERGF